MRQIPDMSNREDEIKESGAGEKVSARRPNPIDVHVGSRVRLRRMILGMSQEKLADQLGLTFQQVQKYEKGVNRVGASRLFELANVLNVPVQFFYDELQSPKPLGEAGAGFAEESSESFIVDFLNSREGLELNRAFVKINDPKVRRSVVDLVRALAEDAGESDER